MFSGVRTAEKYRAVVLQCPQVHWGLSKVEHMWVCAYTQVYTGINMRRAEDGVGTCSETSFGESRTGFMGILCTIFFKV